MSKKTRFSRNSKWKHYYQTQRISQFNRLLYKGKKFFCESCGKCDECPKILILLNRYQEIEFEVRKYQETILFLLQFNKIRNILQLEYARIFANLNEARDMNVFLF